MKNGIHLFRKLILIVIGSCTLHAEESFVEGKLTGQIGNQFFIIATTTSLALDLSATPTFPDLLSDSSNNIPLNFQKVFYHLNTKTPRISSEYHEPVYYYKPLPLKKNIRLFGYFQSEKYFKHHKKEILELLGPHPEIKEYLGSKYKNLISHPNTVAVHLRSYYDYDPQQKIFMQYGRKYYEKAMSLFPSDTLFVVFSNDMNMCKRELIPIKRPMIFIEGEAHYHDLYLMSMCKHQIIGNSSFSWWGAYLNTNPDKKVIAPPHWYNLNFGLDDKDVVPEEWLRLSLD